MALKAGYKGIKKYIADKLNALGDVDSLATDTEVATQIQVQEQLLEDTVGWETINLMGAYYGKVWSSSGTLDDNTNTVSSAKIPVKPGDKFICSKKTALTGSSHNMLVREFDSLGAYASSTNCMAYNVLTSEYTVPADVYYIGVTQNIETVASSSTQNALELTFKKKAYANITAYKPYHASVEESLEGKADNSVIGTVEDGANPTKSYAIGEHMIRGGKFCTVTVAVTTSSTWVEGSNYTSGDVADSLDIEDITASFYTSLGTNWSLGSNKRVYKQGRHIFGDIVLSKTGTMSTTQEVLLTLVNKPLTVVNTGCFVSDSEWNTKDVGYLYINNANGEIIAKTDVANMNVVKIHLDYVY